MREVSVAYSPSRRVQVKKSLRYSILDGSAYSAMQGLAQDYVAPFALELGATTAQVGLLSSVPNFSTAVAELTAPSLTERSGSRKGFILATVLAQAAMWAPLLLVPYLFPGQQIWWLIGFVALNVFFDALNDPAWGSLMTDLVPAGLRGRYFGLRGKTCGIIALIFFFVAGFILNFSSANIFLGFCVLFGGAMGLRFLSGYFISKMYEPPSSSLYKEHKSLLDLVRTMGSSNLGRFLIFAALITFATNLASPFFAVYMLRDLQFDYLTFVAVTAAASLTNLMFLPYWGRRTDKAGSIRVLGFTRFLIPLVPLLWIVSHELYYLIPVQILSGFAWGGFNLAASNFVYDASPPEDRMRCVGLFNAMNAIAICLGALLGGYLALRLPPVLGYNLLTLFLISGLLRALAAVTLLRHVSEVRQVPQLGTMELLLGRGNLAGSAAKAIAPPAFHPVPYLLPRQGCTCHQSTEITLAELAFLDRLHTLQGLEIRQAAEPVRLPPPQPVPESYLLPRQGCGCRPAPGQCLAELAFLDRLSALPKVRPPAPALAFAGALVPSR